MHSNVPVVVSPTVSASRDRAGGHVLIYFFLTVAIGLHFAPAGLRALKPLVGDDPVILHVIAEAERLLVLQTTQVERINADVARLGGELRAELEDLRQLRQQAGNALIVPVAAAQPAVAAATPDDRRVGEKVAPVQDVAPLQAALARLEQSIARTATDMDAIKRLATEAKVGAAAAVQSQTRVEQDAVAQTRAIHDLRKALDIERNKSAVLLLLTGLNVERTDAAQINRRLLDIAGRFPGDDPINLWIAEVKSLLGSQLLTTSALRDRFQSLLPEAIRVARQASGTWVERSKSSAITALSNIGFANPPESGVSELALTKAADLLDRQDLRGALFELSAVDREVAERLSGWIVEAKLRLKLADGVNNIILRANALTD